MPVYMKYLLYLFLLACTPAALYCQNNEADSLKAVLHQNNLPRQQVPVIYARLCVVLVKYNITEAQQYGRKAVDLAKANNAALPLGRGYAGLATVYEAMGKIDAGLQVADSAIKTTYAANDYLGECQAENIYGTLCRRKARYADAMTHHMNAYHIAEKNKDEKMMANSLSGCAIVQMTIKDIDKAVDFHLQALAIRQRLGLTRDIYQSYEGLGIANREKKNYDKALEYYFKAYQQIEPLHDSSAISFTYNDIGAAYSFKGNTALAEKYLKESIAIRERINENHELAYTYNYLGENYERKDDLANAEKNIKKALAIAIAINNSKQTYQAYESLSDFFSRHKVFDSAYHYLVLYKNLRESLAKQDKTEVVAELTARYETEKKEKQIQQQQFEITKRNYYIAGITTVLVSLVLLAWSFYRRYRLKQKAKLQAEILRQQDLASKAVIEAEENERTRISRDLHDGVGQMMSAARMNLSSIENSIQFASADGRKNFDKVIALIDESCNEVRSVSHNMMPNALLKSGLASAVREFIDKIDAHVIKISLHTEGLDERIDKNTETVLYRVIQECVNNVIKHAGASTLYISLIKDQDGISAAIEDNGKGFDTSKMNSFSGIGLKNIVSRVTYLKGTVEWDSSPGRGTLAAVHVPL
jgi:two-component system NarL family sensor kinase